MKTSLFFTSKNCGGCKEMAPIIQKLISEGYKIQSVDFQKERKVANKYDVKILPTIIIFKDSKELARFVGKVEIEKLREIMTKQPDYQIW